MSLLVDEGHQAKLGQVVMNDIAYKQFRLSMLMRW